MMEKQIFGATSVFWRTWFSFFLVMLACRCQTIADQAHLDSDCTLPQWIRVSKFTWWLLTPKHQGRPFWSTFPWDFRTPDCFGVNNNANYTGSLIMQSVGEHEVISSSRKTLKLMTNPLANFSPLLWMSSLYEHNAPWNLT